MGDLWQFNCEKMFFTEQMLASLAPSNFPKGFKNDEGHLPDGVTILRSQLKEATVGYEVDLNLKDVESYESTFNYYHEIKPQLVFWLVQNLWMAERIFRVGESIHRSQHDGPSILPNVCFVLVDDFKEKIWEAAVINGKHRDVSIQSE